MTSRRKSSRLRRSLECTVTQPAREASAAIGARISSLAGPGEILVSSTVKDLVAGSGLHFEDRGEQQLKGVPEVARLFALAARRRRPAPARRATIDPP